MIRRRPLEEKWRNKETEADKIINFIGIGKEELCSFAEDLVRRFRENLWRKGIDTANDSSTSTRRVSLFSVLPRSGIPPISVRCDEKGEIKAKIKRERQIKIKSSFRTVGLGWTGRDAAATVVCTYMYTYVYVCARDSGIVSFTYP